MKVMVMINISTEADLVNRTWGINNNIVLDHRECLEKKEIESGNVTLVYLPVMIVFQLVESTFPRFEGFEDGEIPLFPSEYTFRIATTPSCIDYIHSLHCIIKKLRL